MFYTKPDDSPLGPKHETLLLLLFYYYYY